MFNSVLYVRNICQQRKIPISQLEKDCGFSNGYLNPKKLTKIPYDRAQIIANYLDISISSILTGDQENRTPILTKKDERDIADTMEQLMDQLADGETLMFDGDPMTEEAKASILAAMRLGLEAAKIKNKERFTPKKYRKG